MKKESLKPVLPLLLSGISLFINAPGQPLAPAGHGPSQTKAPETSLREHFMDPPAAFRVAISGSLGQEYVNEGIAGTLLLSGQYPSKQRQGKVDPSWMTNPGLFKELSEKISLAKEKGYLLWFYDEMGYPSCSAGGRVTDGHPELEAQMVRYRSFESSGDALPIKPEGRVVLCAAFPVQDGVIDIRNKVLMTEEATGGEFTWKPPPGDWKLCLYERVPADAWKYHDQARPMGNIMDRKAAARFIELTHKKLEKELGDQIRDIFLFFTDEPQFNCVEYWGEHTRQNVPPAVQWTDELPAAFMEKYGYPLAEALPALFDHAGPLTGRYRHDFYDVSSDLVAKNYWGQIQDWCHENGTYSSGHMLLEETLLYSVMFSGSLIKNWEREDLPGVDLLQLPKYQTMRGGMVIGREGFACKMAASVAAFGNKPGVFSESFAVCDRVEPEPSYLLAAKGVAAWQYYQGVTHMITFSLPQVLTKEEYTDFANYTGRLAVLCRRGRPVSDVAVLIPEASAWACYNPPDGGPWPRYWECNPEVEKIDMGFNETCYALSSNQLDFEMLSEELLQKADIKDGRLHLGDQHFSVLLLPEAQMLGEASMKKVEAFVRGKGRVAFVGSLPHMNPVKGEDDKMLLAAKALLDQDNVRFVKDTTALPSLVNWIVKEVPPEIEWNGPDVVRLAHQRESMRDIIMIANPSMEDASGVMMCRLAGEASIWNPEDGSITEAGIKSPDEEISVSVPANSARFLVLEKTQTANK